MEGRSLAQWIHLGILLPVLAGLLGLTLAWRSVRTASMSLRDVERWIHRGVFLPVLVVIASFGVGLVSVHDGYWEIVAGSTVLMSISGLVALVNAVRLFPNTQGSERQRVVQYILVGALFGVGPLALVILAMHG